MVGNKLHEKVVKFEIDSCDVGAILKFNIIILENNFKYCKRKLVNGAFLERNYQT